VKKKKKKKKKRQSRKIRWQRRRSIYVNTKYIQFTLINLERPKYKNSLVTTINHEKKFVLCKCGNEPSGSI
jgi:transcription initiation factor TFIIIB Brf1 subunit/transcription initiation factor TFIIB